MVCRVSPKWRAAITPTNCRAVNPSPCLLSRHGAWNGSAWHVLISRSLAWLGRGVRTPIRKALLAGSVTKETYGRAFGFERMMDTLGAIVGPATAFVLLPLVNQYYPTLFALTLIPGLIAVA